MKWLNIFELEPIGGNRYLVCDKYFKEVKILTYNSICSCWDDEEGDDFYCDFERANLYMELPEYKEV